MSEHDDEHEAEIEWPPPREDPSEEPDESWAKREEHNGHGDDDP